MKLAGAALLLTACIMTGMQLSLKISGRVRRLHAIRRMLAQFSSELSYRRLSTGEMLREAAANADLKMLPFLKQAAAEFDASAPFSAVWEKAVCGNHPSFPAEEREILLETGRLLGSFDSGSQQAGLALLMQRTDGLTAEKAEKAAGESRLCRSLGVLAGLFLLILIL